uniref:Uncharacterized protein n=1 Tax=viral metagenome TaxID=1070528 RepID=A0A6H1ZUL7_9ZZZZ
MSDDWNLDAQGNVAVAPVAGWKLASFAGMGVVFRLDYLDGPDALARMETTSSAQFVLLPAQALELAEAIRVRAEAALAPSREPKN